MNNDKSIIEVEKLSKYFKSGSTTVKAVDEVSFTLPRGKLIVIRGASGSGKSSLLNLLGALDRPTGGTIIVDGALVSEMRGKEESDYRLKKVGFVFQSYYLIPAATALENVMIPMELIHLKSSERQLKARKLLADVGIDPAKQSRRPSKLSGGEQQRVAIARAMANDPTLILADEPTGNLDSKTGQTVIDILCNTTKKGTTVVLATHDSSIAAKADVLIDMQDGKIMSSSTID
jgi:ABC-type lipoprotein export system ATPase subunit